MKTKFGQNIDLEKKGIIFGQVMERFASVIDAESTLTIDGMFGYVISEGIYLNIQGVVTKIAPSIDNLTKSTAFYSATEPTSGVVTGVLWFDTGESKLKIFNGSIWVTITPDAGTLLTIEQINDINNIANKLDKGSYTGNASDLFDLASSKVSNTQPSGDANRRFIINADGSVTLGLNVVSTLQSTTDSGSETTNKITSNRLEGSVGFEVNSTGSTVLKTSISNESYDIENETLGLRTKIKSNGISFTTYTNNANGLDILVPTSNVMNSGRHTITYPYASGEIALKSNVEERVPYTGAVNDVDLGDNFIKLGKRGSKSSKNEFITYLKDSVLDSDVFRRQDRIWNGTTFIDVNHSYLIGEGSGLNNTGRRLLSYGRNSGTNNTGNYSILIGYSAGLNNTGTDLLAIGHNSALNNTSTYSVFIGNNSGLNNIGGNAVGVGYSSLSNNTGNSATALGYNALQNNTGNSSSGIGHIVMQHNTGSNSNGFGLKSLQHNSGHISNGFGVYSLQYNKANGAVGVGGYSLQNNTGVDSVGLGLYSLNFNNGDKSLGLGSYSLRYNDGVGNIAIGDNAWSNFIEDVPNIKTFSNTDVNDSLKRFTITGHGFGSVGSTINLKFKVVSGSSSVNMSNNSVYQFKVIDNDTLEIANSIVVSSITFNNVGSYTFTPQTVFTNSISLGSNSQPTKSNQVVLGDDNIVEVYSKGVFKTGAEIADITDNKHLVTLEKLNSVGVPYTGAINDVDLGSHTIKLGREEVILNKAKHQISLLDNIGSPLFRRQTHYWNSTTSQFSTTQGNGFGYNSLQNNIAQQSNGFGDFSLQNNTGQQSNGFGLNALQNNTGTYSSGFGNDSLRYNTGAYSSGFGHQTLRNNTGAYATGVGYNSLRDNKGGNNSAFGSFSLRRSENNMNSAFGFGTLQDLTIGTNNNAFGALASSESNNVTKTNSFGTFALAKNTGSNVVGIGDYSGYSNNGSYVVGVGSTSVRNNFGSHVVGIGLDSGYFNIGDKNIGVGYRTNYLTQGSENVAIGFGSNSEFIDDVSKEITFTSTNVDFTNNRITLTNHNLGSTNSIVLLRYINVSGSTIGGIFNNGYFSFKIIDINTIEIVNYNITNQGSDNHKLVPSIVFNNTVSLGSNSQPTKSNQVVLGDDNIVEVYSKGVFKTGAEIADITDNKHLVTLEKLNSVGVPYTGATSNVDLGFNIINANKEVTVTDKAKHVESLYVYNNPILRYQVQRWNGSAFQTSNSFGFGFDSLQNNTGEKNSAFGRFSLENNTGDSSNGFGEYSLRSNTGANSNGFGNQSLQQNSGNYSNGFGNYALRNNTALHSNGFGYYALQNNVGANSNGFGNHVMQNNTGSDSNGFGHFTMQNNTGTNSNGFGHNSLKENSGAFASGFGNYSLLNNNASHSSGFGYGSLMNNKATNSNGFGVLSLQENLGNSSNGFGVESLALNVGNDSNGFGRNALHYNVGDNNVALGNSSAYSFFDVDVSKDKIVNSSNIDFNTNRITITSHGYGSNNSHTIIRYISQIGGVIPTGLSNNQTYIVKIIDANTIEFVNKNLNNNGSGTHLIQTQFKYTNTVSLGYFSRPTKSNQVVLGDDNIVEVYSKGVFKTGAEIADITDNKHLISKEYYEANAGVPYTGATGDVDLGDNTINSNKEVVVLNKARHIYSVKVLNIPLFRYQKDRWDGSTFQASNSFGFGFNALQNNIGSSNNAFGNGALQNNTGTGSIGFGENSLQNNAGGTSSGFGNSSLQNNTGHNSDGFGAYSLQSNTANNVIGIGGYSMQNNSGNTTIGIGYASGNNNTGHNSVGVGFQSIRNNTANNVIGIGYNALQYNTGSKAIGIGHNSAIRNSATDLISIGYVSGEENIGNYSIAIGSQTMLKNIGHSSVGIGFASLRFNIGDNNVALGSNTTYSEFLLDVSKDKIVNSSDFDFNTNRLTITGHGYGAINGYNVIKYVTQSGGTRPTGLINGGFYIIKIIDTNTIEFVNNNLSNNGVGTHLIQTQFKYDNTVVLGDHSIPTKSNQVVLGNENIVEVYSKGVFKTGAEIADITDDKHLISKEYHEANSGVPYTGATNDVNLGNHTIELGKEEVITDKAKHEISLLDNNGRPLFRKQTHYWNGISFSTTNGSGFGIDSLMNNIGYSSCAFGSYSLRNNTGYESNGFGYFALDNNTGSRSNGFGYFSLQNNTGNNSNGFGFHSLKNNTGGFSSGFGNSALSGNTGNNSNGFGYLSLSSNTGNNASGFGHASLLQNTGFNSSGFGYSVLQFNTGNNSNGFGYISLQKNKGTSSNGFGNYSLELNDGIYSNGFGHNSLRYNNGDESNGFGHSSLIRNIGSDSNGFGNNSLRYNQGSNNSGFGHNSYSVFDENVTNKKGFTNTDIDSVNKRINITSHGFGAINSIVNLKYILVSGGSIALGNNDIYTFKIIDNDTIEILYNGIVGTNVGTHELIPQNTFNNTTSLGYGSQPTKSNQVVLGNSLTDEVFSEGNFKSNAPKSSIIDPKHLVTVEYVEDLPKDSNFAIVKLGSISHIPEFGSLDKHFNSISDVFDKIASSANKYDDVGFKIYLIGTGTFSLTTSTTYHFKDISIISRDENILELNSEIRLDNPVLDMTSTTLNMLAPNKIMFKGNVKMNLKKFDLIGTNTTFFTPLSFLYYTDHSSRISEIDINISEYVFNGNIGATGVLGCSGYNKVNLNINKLTIIKDTSWSYLFGFSSTLESISNVNINIGHIDALTSNGNIVMFNATGLSAADMKTNNFKPNRGGTINLKVGDINAPNASDFRMFNGVRSGLYNVDINGNINCPPFKLFLHPSLLYGMEFNLTGNIESNHFGYLVDGYDQTKLPATDVETCIINIKDFKVKSSDVFGQLLRTRSHVSQSLSVDVVPVPIIVENVTFDTQSAKIGVVQGSLTVDDPLTKPMIEFKGINKFTMVSSTHLLQINDGDLNMLNANPSIILNSGKIQHNATNADYTDERAMVTKESKYTHEI